MAGRVKILLAVVGAVGILFAGALGVDAARSSFGAGDKPGLRVAEVDDGELVPAPALPDEVPTASDFWALAKEGMDCIRADGGVTYGPYPTTDGSNIFYMYDASLPKETQTECLSALEGASAAYALNESSSSDTGAEVPGRGATHGRDDMMRIRTELLECLQGEGLVPDNADEVAAAGEQDVPEWADGPDLIGPAFGLAEMEGQAEFRDCVDSVG